MAYKKDNSPFHTWLVGCFGFNGLLRQYFSLYRAVSQREGERGEKGQMREKMSKQPPPAPTASATGPCPTIIQISRTPRHWKFTQYLRTTPLSYFFSYFPMMVSDAALCSLHNLKTVWNIIMILHSYVEQIMTTCRVQE